MHTRTFVMIKCDWHNEIVSTGGIASVSELFPILLWIFQWNLAGPCYLQGSCWRTLSCCHIVGAVRSDAIHLFVGLFVSLFIYVLPTHSCRPLANCCGKLIVLALLGHLDIYGVTDISSPMKNFTPWNYACGGGLLKAPISAPRVHLLVFGINFQIHFVSPVSVIRLSTHLCHHHHSRHPSLFHSRLKTYLSTNPFHFNILLYPLDCLHDNGTGPDLSCSSVYFILFYFFIFCSFHVVDSAGYPSASYCTLSTRYYIVVSYRTCYYT